MLNGYFLRSRYTDWSTDAPADADASVVEELKADAMARIICSYAIIRDRIWERVSASTNVMVPDTISDELQKYSWASQEYQYVSLFQFLKDLQAGSMYQELVGPLIANLNRKQLSLSVI